MDCKWFYYLRFTKNWNEIIICEELYQALLREYRCYKKILFSLKISNEKKWLLIYQQIQLHHFVDLFGLMVYQPS